MSGKLGGTRLAVAVAGAVAVVAKAASKNLAPVPASSPSVATLTSPMPSATGGMQASVRAKVEQVGQAAAAAMPTLTMTDHAAIHELARQNAKTEKASKHEEFVAVAAQPTISATSASPAPSSELKTLPVDLGKPADPIVISELKTHRVRRGENLTHIATKYGVDLESLQKINHLDSQRGRRKGQIRVGQILTIPSDAVLAKAGAAADVGESVKNSDVGGPSPVPLAVGPSPVANSKDEANSIHDSDAQKLIDAKALPGATATPGATPRLSPP